MTAMISTSFGKLLLESVAVLVEVKRIKSKLKQTPRNILATQRSSYVFFFCQLQKRWWVSEWKKFLQE